MTDDHDLFAGCRVRLRAVRPEDADEFHRDGRDSEAARYGDEVRLPQSAAALRERIERTPKPDDHNVWLAIESIETDALVGSINVHGANPRHGDFEYGIGVFREFWRRGYATDAVTVLLRHYFRELGYHRATALVYEFNAPSIALHRKLGFTEEGRIRESIFTDGRYHDEVLFGMLAGEFSDLERTLARAPAWDAP